MGRKKKKWVGLVKAGVGFVGGSRYSVLRMYRDDVSGKMREVVKYNNGSVVDRVMVVEGKKGLWDGRDRMMVGGDGVGKGKWVAGVWVKGGEEVEVPVERVPVVFPRQKGTDACLREDGRIWRKMEMLGGVFEVPMGKEEMALAVVGRREFKGEERMRGEMIREVRGEWRLPDEVLKVWAKVLLTRPGEAGCVYGKREKDGKWMAVIPPQKCSGGECDMDKLDEASMVLLRMGKQVGTIHTHPGDMVGYSGTDEKDLFSKVGGVHWIIPKSGRVGCYVSVGGSVWPMEEWGGGRSLLGKEEMEKKIWRNKGGLGIRTIEGEAVSEEIMDKLVKETRYASVGGCNYGGMTGYGRMGNYYDGYEEEDWKVERDKIVRDQGKELWNDMGKEEKKEIFKKAKMGKIQWYNQCEIVMRWRSRGVSGNIPQILYVEKGELFYCDDLWVGRGKKIGETEEVMRNGKKGHKEYWSVWEWDQSVNRGYHLVLPVFVVDPGTWVTDEAVRLGLVSWDEEKHRWYALPEKEGGLLAITSTELLALPGTKMVGEGQKMEEGGGGSGKDVPEKDENERRMDLDEISGWLLDGRGLMEYLRGGVGLGEDRIKELEGKIGEIETMVDQWEKEGVKEILQ